MIVVSRVNILMSGKRDSGIVETCIPDTKAVFEKRIMLDVVVHNLQCLNKD